MKGTRKKLAVMAMTAVMGNLIPLVSVPVWGQTTWNVPGDGSNACTTANPSCNTIQQAVDAASSGDTIDIAAGAFQENVGISKNLILQGAGADNTVVEGIQNGAPVFAVGSATVTIEGMTIENGMGTLGGGISSFSSAVDVNNCIISNNTVVMGGVFPGQGGGILIDGESTMNINNSIISGNMADIGGGIINDGVLTITDSTLSSNGAQGRGGGIFNGGTVTVTSSTISSNSAEVGGGGIYNNNGTVTISNSTINGDSANQGGGIFNEGMMTITNSTISENTAFEGGGGIFNNGGTVQLSSSIVANTPSGGDCSGSITSLGYNLESGNSCGLTSTGDLPNTDPKLGPLQDNGGPTETQALLTGSPAIDAGNPDCPPPDTDQRGITRPQGTRCDIGAFEAEDSDNDGIPDILESQGGGGCSIASVGVKPSIPLYLLIPIFIVIRRVWRRNIT